MILKAFFCKIISCHIVMLKKVIHNKKRGTCCFPFEQQAPPSALPQNRITSSPAPIRMCEDRAYSSLEAGSLAIKAAWQNWRFRCSRNPNIHVSNILLQTCHRLALQRYRKFAQIRKVRGGEDFSTACSLVHMAFRCSWNKDIGSGLRA